MSEYEPTREYAQSMDAADPMREFRDQFHMPVQRNGMSCVYLCGNSLGMQPKLAAEYVNEELEDWANLGVEGHLHARRPWLSYHRNAVQGFAELTGSEDNEVVAMASISPTRASNSS